MANIETKQREELSYNARIMVDTIDTHIDGGGFPITAFLDASVEEMSEAVKYLIDSGWLSNRDLYAGKVKSNVDNSLVKDAVLFVRSKDDFDYGVNRGYISMPKGTPIVIGTPKAYEKCNQGCLERKHDGDVFIELEDGKLVSICEWKDQQEHKTMTNRFKPSSKKTS
ncbi:MAG: hypothetical protein IKZ96_02065 [Bacilli bacterium]|nr:hypothetical protein [Bacilli bacterium]